MGFTWITHDSLTDWYKTLQVKAGDDCYFAKKKLGAIDIWCEYGGNGVEARLKSP